MFFAKCPSTAAKGAADGRGNSSGAEFNRDVLNNYLFNLRTLETVRDSLLDRRAELSDKISALGHSSPADADTCADCPSHSAAAGRNGHKSGMRQNRVKAGRESDEKSSAELRAEELDGKIEKADALLKKAYSVNVIPNRYRNIYSVYFLCDCLSSSGTTLKDALLNCGSDGIIERFDPVIEQHGKAIVQLAGTNARDDIKRRQDNEMFARAIKSERDTIFAVQYGRIAAVNSQVAAYCQAF